jgi:tRNA threonylcarbamoyl adenosine modification protein (Sua5/YciO/YrdC/YwlC family)
MMRVLSIIEDGMERCVYEVTSELARHRPVILPTETLYGLASTYDDPECISQIFRLKGRPRDMTLPITVPSKELIGTIGHYPLEHRSTIERFMPGPVTIIIRARSELPEGLARNGTIAVRVPDHPLFIPLCARTGPLVMTSANLHGAQPVKDVMEAMEQFGTSIGLMVKDGSVKDALPSTIIDLTGKTVDIIRDGVVPRSVILGQNGPMGSLS